MLASSELVGLSSVIDAVYVGSQFSNPLLAEFRRISWPAADPLPDASGTSAHVSGSSSRHVNSRPLLKMYFSPVEHVAGKLDPAVTPPAVALSVVPDMERPVPSDISEYAEPVPEDPDPRSTEFAPAFAILASVTLAFAILLVVMAFASIVNVDPEPETVTSPLSPSESEPATGSPFTKKLRPTQGTALMSPSLSTSTFAGVVDPEHGREIRFVRDCPNRSDAGKSTDASATNKIVKIVRFILTKTTRNKVSKLPSRSY